MHAVKRNTLKALDKSFRTLVRHIGSDVVKDQPGYLTLSVGKFDVRVGLGGDYIFVLDAAAGKGYNYRYDQESVSLVSTGKDYPVRHMSTRTLRQLQKGISIALATLPEFNTPELVEFRKQRWQAVLDKMDCNAVWGGMGTASAVSTLYQPGLTETITETARTATASLEKQVNLDADTPVAASLKTIGNAETEHMQRMLEKRIATKQAMRTNYDILSDAQGEFYGAWHINDTVSVTFTEHYSKGYVDAIDAFTAAVVGTH